MVVSVLRCLLSTCIGIHWTKMGDLFIIKIIKTGLILGLHAANARCRYKVTPSHWLGANLESALWRCHLASVVILLGFCQDRAFVWTHWGRVTYICVSKLTIIGSDNGLSPDRRQAIIWTIAGLLFIGPLGTNFSEILVEILTFSFQKMRSKVSSAKRRPFCLGLNVLNEGNGIRHNGKPFGQTG